MLKSSWIQQKIIVNGSQNGHGGIFSTGRQSLCNFAAKI